MVTEWSTEKVDTGSEIRTFDSNGLFEWHQDLELRTVTVLSMTGFWQFQYDNDKPFWIRKGSIFVIESLIWHRMIPVREGKIELLITF